MRLVLIVGVVWAVLSGLGLGNGFDHAASARGETPLGRDACTKLALERKSLEKGGIRKYLAMQPQNVVSTYGLAVVERVRHYISLSEKVLFQCPLNVLNATAAPLASRSGMVPPLPVKGPRRRARVGVRVRAPRLLVPLPVKRTPL